MGFDVLERRTDPRTQAFVPVTLCCQDTGQDTPAHLLDLSCGGAGVLITAYNAPALGQYVDLRFDMPGGRGGLESDSRLETGIVVNARSPERGIARIGIRFLQHRDVSGDLFDPREILTAYRQRVPAQEQGNRWQTALGFQGLCPCPPPAAAN
jgi:hypothetical protein